MLKIGLCELGQQLVTAPKTNQRLLAAQARHSAAINRAPSDQVNALAFIEQNVSRHELKLLHVSLWEMHLIEVREIDLPIENIGYSKIGPEI